MAALDRLSLLLLVACENGDSAAVKQLLSAGGARPDCRDPETGESPVYAAAREGYAETLDLLARHGANVDQVEVEGFSPLYMAAQNNHCKAADRLLAAQASVDLAQPNGGTPLLIATQLGHAGMAHRLMDAGADVNRQNCRGTTPLYIATQYGNVRLMRRLLQAGAAPDLAETDGTAPLWIAAQNDHLEAARQLVLAGASVDQRRLETNSTALFIAAEVGNLDIVDLLLRAAADTELANRLYETPLYTAAWYGNLSVVDRLVRAGAVVEAVRFDGTTALYRAAVRGHPAVVERLLAAGADVNRRRAVDGKTALLGAAKRGDSAMVELLLRAGADAALARAAGGRPRDDDEATVRTTPLRAAVEFGHVDTVRVLLGAGAAIRDGTNDVVDADEDDVGRRNRWEEFLRDSLACGQLARRRGLHEIVRLLEAFWEAPRTSRPGPAVAPSFDAENAAGASAEMQPGGATPSSLELHEAFNAAGFRGDRAAFQCAMADVLEEVIRGHRNTAHVHLVGSYSEGWGNSLVSLNGRTDPDSDLDVTEYAHKRLFHIRGRCRCRPEPDPGDVLDYEGGHVFYEGAGSNPSLPDKGSPLRPAMDLVAGFACCCYPEIGVLLPGSERHCHLPAGLLAELRAELARPQSCHLIRASAPGQEARQLRVSTTFLERRFMRSLTTVQGQLFLVLKFLIKRVICSGEAGSVRGLKSYHAKTLTFRAVADTESSQWQPDRLLELVTTALDDLLHCLESSPPGECMPHFFMRDGALYLRRRSSAKADISAAVATTRANLGRHLARLTARELQPLQPDSTTAGFRLHPFTLLPVYLQLPYPASGQLEYHQVYTVVLELTLKLGDSAASRTSAELEQMRRLAGRLSADCAHTARACLLALILLRMDRPLEAAQQLRISFGFERPRQRPLLRSIPPALAAATDDGGRANLRRLLRLADSAWRFCFFCEQPLPGPSFDYLLPSRWPHVRLPCRMANYENFFYVSFEALARLLCSQLAPDLLADEAAWFQELLASDPDWLELAVFAGHSGHPGRLASALARLRVMRPHSREMLRDVEEKIARLVMTAQ